MPYARTLDRYVLPEFSREAPAAWVRRLREISPVTDRMSWLGFRWMEPSPAWLYQEPNGERRGCWLLYAHTPRHLIGPERAAQFERHWSELPTNEQAGRKAYVSNYQHFMWHSQNVEVKPFWILQGTWGGTPAIYSRREKRILDAQNAWSDPYPVGMFEPIPFDERVVRHVLERDRLRKAEMSLATLDDMDRPASMKIEDDAAEVAHRVQFLKTTHEMFAAQHEFFKYYFKQDSANQELPPAPVGTADAVAQFRDQFIEHGTMPNATTASARPVSVNVLAAV